MNIDRPMVSLFFEIKRNMPFEEREEMKIASPDVGKQLVSIYQATDNQALKTLIEKFMDRAGAKWAARLNRQKKAKLIFYRGRTANRPHAA